MPFSLWQLAYSAGIPFPDSRSLLPRTDTVTDTLRHFADGDRNISLFNVASLMTDFDRTIKSIRTAIARSELLRAESEDLAEQPRC